ncbi:hypothetical protein D7W82_00425 [Corallococcus sp. CA049B]|uniref:hypothetical protein n=1 Tax=Corallococcus sp. CA049B TaxID=2316730 RepID=UPI000EA3E53C|nr:hypothetical protein [Corallococcus sp. CA049B]RKG91555.1 hypothetical protein D7W82_00425 [Corallococcus sp. CA049B]
MPNHYSQKKCNHCQDRLPENQTSLALCIHCRATLCGSCTRKYRFGGIGKNRGCPRSPKLRQGLWQPSSQARPVRSAFHIPFSCGACGRYQNPKQLIPLQWSKQGAWGCTECATHTDLQFLQGQQLQAPSMTFCCGTWNIQKYGSSSPLGKRQLVPLVIANMLGVTEADWLIVQEVTDAKLFIGNMNKQLKSSRLGHYKCSGGELTLGSGGTKDHYVLIYNTQKVSIVLGPLHFGSSERPLEESTVLFNRHNGGGVQGPVAGHRGSVGWLLSTVPYRSSSSLIWTMGVHTSPSGSTNMIPAQIHEIITHAATLRHDGIPVILAGDWYMQNDAPGYACSLEESGWQLIAPKYGTSLKHRNTEHTIQVADHLIVSDSCQVQHLWQFVPVNQQDQQGGIGDLQFPRGSVESIVSNPNLVTKARQFVRINTPQHLWEQLGGWLDLGIDHSPVVSQFTVQFDEGRRVEVPRNLNRTINEWSHQIVSNPPLRRSFTLNGKCPDCSGKLQPIESGGERILGEFTCPRCEVQVTVPGGRRVQFVRIQ